MNQQLELFSHESIQRTMVKDAKIVSTTVGEYLEDNHVNYYVAINTWLHILKTVSPYGWFRVSDMILEKGFISVIRTAQDASDSLLHGVPVKDPMWAEVLYDCRNHLDNFRQSQRLEPELNIGRDFMATALYILRYPKRFTPVDNDIVQEATLKEFLSFENRTKMWQRRYWSPIMCELVRNEISQLLNWDSVVTDIRKNCDDFVYSTGVATDSDSTIGSKFVAMYQAGSYGNIPLFLRPGEKTIQSGSYGLTPKHVVKVLAVPKSYKASRIIAMEDTYRQAHAKRVSLILRKYAPRDIDVTDQTRNQELARIGSIDGQYSTLDLSHGSDAVSTRLVREIYPADYLDLIFPLMGTHTDVNGKIRLTQTFSTAGHSLTFDTETQVFYAIAKAACNVGRRFRQDSAEPHVSVFGDDIIVPTIYVDIVIQFLEYFGFIINRDKSFTSTKWKYRESCGEEYLNGISTTSLYYPRFPIVGKYNKGKTTLSKRIYSDGFRGKKEDATSMLIDLQHKLYNVCYPASRFVFELVRSVYPKLTFSQPGSNGTDLWEFGDSTIERKFPRGEFLPSGELHYLPSSVPEFDDYQTRDLGGKCAELVSTHPSGVDFVHSTPVIKYELSARAKELSDKYFDLFRYYEFLRTGPRYRDKLSKLLNVTEAPATPEMIFGKPVFVWKLRG
jgi:hypothetical protein